VSSHSPQTPALVRRETRSAVALLEHDSTTSKPPTQRYEAPPLLSRSTSLHVAPPITCACRESQIWAVANLGSPLQPLRNPNFGTLLLPLQIPSFGMLLQPLRNPSFWTLLSPLQISSFGTLLQPLRNPSFGMLLPPL